MCDIVRKEAGCIGIIQKRDRVRQRYTTKIKIKHCEVGEAGSGLTKGVDLIMSE